MSVTSEITALQNTTAFNQTKNERTVGMQNDTNTFLTLMLKQLENQDPTNPTDNTEWLSQLAQYSSLEQMTQMNSGLEKCAKSLSELSTDLSLNSEINQTLSMIGKDVTLAIPDEKDATKINTVSGRVTEASFEDGTGKIKIGDNYYSISNVISIRE